MVEIDPNVLKNAQDMLKGIPGAAKKAAKTAIRKTVRGAKQDAVRKVKERYTIQPGDISRIMDIGLSGDGLSGELRSKGRVNSLADFKHNPRSVPKNRWPTGKYLYAQVIKGEGGTIAHAFLARMANGHVGIFQRGDHGESNASLPIFKLNAPSVPQMLESATICGFLQKRMEERLQSNMDHEVNAFLMGYRK